MLSANRDDDDNVDDPSNSVEWDLGTVRARREPVRIQPYNDESERERKRVQNGDPPNRDMYEVCKVVAFSHTQ